MLKNYGGHHLDFIAQVEITLSRGQYQLITTILARKDAPNDLLLGTDVQPQLGFSLGAKGADGSITDLFTGERLPPTELKQTVKELNGEQERYDGREVRLLQAVKVPAGMQQVVRATLEDTPLKGPLMFTPSELSPGLQMADSVVEMADDQFVTLVLQNNGVEKECLEEGTHLGVVTTTTVVSSDESDSSRSAELSRLQSIAIDDPPQGEAEKQQERDAKLFSQLYSNSLNLH